MGAADLFKLCVLGALILFARPMKSSCCCCGVAVMALKVSNDCIQLVTEAAMAVTSM